MEKGCAECHSGINMGGHDYFPFGVMENEQEVTSITAFLQTTTGLQPFIVYPTLPASTDSTPRPLLE